MFKIYTAGKMAGLDFCEQMGWRRNIENVIRQVADNRGVPQSKFQFVHPPEYYQYGTYYFQSEKEVKDWDLNQVRNSDIIIVDLDTIDDSIGTHFELGMADAVNSFGNKHIFVIGIGDKNKELHPWILESLHRREETYEDAARYIVDYLLV